jgi:hypothetical protein
MTGSKVDIPDQDPDIAVPSPVVRTGDLHRTFFRYKKLFLTHGTAFIKPVIDIPVNQGYIIGGPADQL